MNLLIGNSNLVVEDNGVVTQEFPLSVGEEISLKESYTIKLPEGGTTDISFNGPTIGKGVFINSNCLLNVTSGTTNVSGENLYLNRIYIPNMNITSLGKIQFDGEVNSQTNGTGTVTIVVKDKNFLHSTLTGTPVIEPFNVDGLEFLIKIENYAILSMELEAQDGADITTGDGIASSLTDQINAFVGIDLVDITYSVDHKFIIKCELTGPIGIEMLAEGNDNRLYLGMSSPILELGTETFVGNTVVIVSGDEVGEGGVITAMTNTDITFTSTALAMSSGDLFYVKDTTAEATVGVFVYQ